MTNKLKDLISKYEKQEYATAVGRAMHNKMRYVFYTPDGWTGDPDIVNRASSVPELMEFMSAFSQTEVPIAGWVDGKFISRRIDRLYVNNVTKKVVVLDYKTDINKNMFFDKYCEQLIEYYKLLKQIYNGFDVQCKILWLNDFTLENII